MARHVTSALGRLKTVAEQPFAVIGIIDLQIGQLSFWASCSKGSHERRGVSKIIDFSEIESAHMFEQFAGKVLRNLGYEINIPLAKGQMAAGTFS